MLKTGFKLVSQLLIYFTVIPSLYLLFIYSPKTVSISDDKVFVLNEVSEFARYRTVSDTSYECDLSGVSNIINRMVLDDYAVTKYAVDSKTIDVIFEKDSEVYRIYFEYPNKLTLLAAPYEKSKYPVVFINEKEN